MADAEEERPAPLRIAALVKQVPVAESLELGPDGRLRRDGAVLEMNPYCRRAVSKGVELAKATGGTCTVFTLGPPAAEDVLREAVAWGADAGVHLCDPVFAGSDTLATARALAGALDREGPFDLVLVGRNSTDGDTGQVGPELAELVGLPFACGARRLELADGRLRLDLELDDGWQELEVSLPALVAVAERLCDPCKVDPEGRRAVSPDRLRRLMAADLGEGPWGDAGSPTVVGSVRVLQHRREGQVLSGPIEEQVAEAVRLLQARGALERGARPDDGAGELGEEAARSAASGLAVDLSTGTDGADGAHGNDRPVIAVILEPGRPQAAGELLGAAARLAGEVGGTVVAIGPAGDGEPAERLGALGADEVVDLLGEPVAEDVAAALTAWAVERSPWVVLAPGTVFGREVAARTAAATGSGLVGDAIAVDVVDGRLVAAKPAFSGALVADITCRSAMQLVTVRPGVLPVPVARPRVAGYSVRALAPRGRVRVLSSRHDDDVEVLARAEAVIGVGAGVVPDEYADLSPLAAILGAELAATRKVTDKGWAPRARQVGITGRSIAPRLYVAIGISGKFNHMVGVRAAGTVLAVNPDPEAPVFGHADLGIVGDWHEVLPLLQEALREAGHDRAGDGEPRGGDGTGTLAGMASAGEAAG
ncbi:MAG TPA: FAD-binding protein [Acidimicrobiales bacterium]|nr:FAD-binding protein [Acidimicrobiales bacterium]